MLADKYKVTPNQMTLAFSCEVKARAVSNKNSVIFQARTPNAPMVLNRIRMIGLASVMPRLMALSVIAKSKRLAMRKAARETVSCISGGVHKPFSP